MKWNDAFKVNPKLDGEYLVKDGGNIKVANFKDGCWDERPFANWSIGKVTICMCPTEWAEKPTETN